MAFTVAVLRIADVLRKKMSADPTIEHMGLPIPPPLCISRKMQVLCSKDEAVMLLHLAEDLIDFAPRESGFGGKARGP